MSKKKVSLEIIIISIVIVLSFAYILFKKTDKVHYKVPELINIKVNSLTKISISKGDRVVDLENKKDGWVVGEDGFKTDKFKIDKITNIVSNLKLTTLVSKSGNYYKYELDDPRKINVRVFSGKDIVREFDTGKVASTYDHTNVKIKGDNNIYHAGGSIQKDLDKTIDDLRYKKVFLIEKDKIKQITFNLDGKEYVLNKSIIPVTKEEKNGSETEGEPEVETRWDFNKTKIENSEVNSILGIVSNLSCDEYVYTGTDLKAAEQLFSVKLVGSIENSITIYKLQNKEDEKYRGETSQTEYKFFIKKFRIDNFLNPLKKIFGIEEEEN
ncbi:MAG: DUF4340 domain-containing protein [Candidatus Aminicenantes bacterium]|nr:DUF4340 domain-containing protein [Candidatus Aminicenantes bacterium]